ncbi:MAG: flagellar hook-basal body complex protein [Desulfovibrio sp.]|jgi:flagellar hook protein FlgE|nr:flagellar hook-basal body complex protein [Desulfovibrio sp.]
MNSALYIGATGMKGLSEGMAVTANNLANVSTIAFKHQDIQYSDLIYTTQAHMGEWWQNQTDSRVAVGQLGKGLQVETVRTIFQQGGMESSGTLTDLAINGKGFFQVTDGVSLYYTRAGDFRPDSQGVLRNPEGLALNGYRLNPDGSRGELQAVQIDRFGTMPAKASGSMRMILNLGLDSDRTSDPAHPYFSLLSAYDANADPPISAAAAGFTQSVTLYDASGQARQATIYFDKVSDLSASAGSVVEFLIAADVRPPADGTPLADGAGLLMSGTLIFSGSGQLADMAAFTPAVAGDKNLQNWQPAGLADGLPQLILEGTPVTVDFGIKAAGGWEHAPASANDVTTQNTLPSMGNSAIRAQDASTAYGGSPPLYLAEQDGYPEGALSYYSIGTDGVVTGYYSNGQGQDLWQIPLCRFTSEDGLRRQGNNLFAATAASGQMEMGMPGTENYGKVYAYNIELSNVDMATEMVNMIITQRGFQSNSKVVTTADQMLQRAIELKRS